MSYFTSFVIVCFLIQATSTAPAIQPHLAPLDNGPGDPDSNAQLWDPVSPVIPEPTRGKLGANILGPQNLDLEQQNADLLAPPTTDHGQVENLKWPFSLSHTRLSDGGWSRQQNVDVLPAATELAGKNYLILEVVDDIHDRCKYALESSELHWHKTAEGEVRISTMTPEGQIFVGDVSEGDLWYLPAGNPHSIQAKNTTKDGAEFILIFDSGKFAEDATFLLTDWLAHVPKGVLAKNFGVTDLTSFEHIPEKELYIFPSVPPPEDPTADMVIPNNTPNPYVFPLSKSKPTKTPGGSVKLVDSRTFKVAEKISAVEVVVEVGGMRELHWHPTEPEWTFYISGEARVTIFASEANAHTFNFQAGDVGYVPPTYGHYIENTGNTTLKFLEVFQGGIVQDISLTQWLALTPPSLIKAHLGFSDELIGKLSRVKQEVV
ncbi:Oxalate decarboxylase oxdC [Termitomyces sp. J132]|nr:Oxalate decarboxylase oxdC [Termitomyces sp. J132]